MEVSVIVPTFNGAKKIPRLLEALLSQSVKDFELIIVVDGSSDNTWEVVNKYDTKFSKLKIMVQENGGRAAVRNKGALESTGNLLIFYDDDTEPHINSIQKHIEFHQANPKAVLGGTAMEYYGSAKTDIQNYKAWLCQKWISDYETGINKLTKQSFFLTAANMSVSANVFQLLNGFDEHLADAEDQDFAFRALKNNLAVYFDKSNIAIHHDPITCESYINRTRQYSFAMKKLYDIHPNRYPNRTAKTTNFIKRIIYRLFAFRFWQKWIDKHNLFVWLPKAIRYKLYDVIIHALGREYQNVRLN